MMQQQAVVPIPYLGNFPRDLKYYVARFFDPETLANMKINKAWRAVIQHICFQKFQQEYPRLYRNLYAQIPGFSNWSEAYGVARRKDEQAMKNEAKLHLFRIIRDKDANALMTEMNSHSWTGNDLCQKFDFLAPVEALGAHQLAHENGFDIFLSEFYLRLSADWQNNSTDVAQWSKDIVRWAVLTYQPIDEITQHIERLKCEEDFNQICFGIAGVACDNGCLDVLRYLLEVKKQKFSDKNCGSDPWELFLWRACFYGHLAVVQYLLMHTPAKEALRFRSGNDASLEAACSSGDLATVRCLVENGAVIYSPKLLVNALERESLLLLRFLVEETDLGRELNYIDPETEKYWFWKVCGVNHVAIVEYLIDRFEVNRTQNGMTTLDDFFSGFAEARPRELNHVRVAKTLITHGGIFKQHCNEGVESGVAFLIQGHRELTQHVLSAYIRSLGARHPFLKRAASVLLQVFSLENPTQDNFNELERFVKPFVRREGHMLSVLYFECMNQMMAKMDVEQQFSLNYATLRS